MKSICIKTNMPNLLDYLLNEFKTLNLDNICFSSNSFKNYKNIIIHYKGENEKEFISDVSSILSCLVLDEMEKKFLKNLIFKNYFYFDALERQKILNICMEISSDDISNYFEQKLDYLCTSFTNYIQNNKTLVLSGFVNFRLPKYFSLLEGIIDDAVNMYLFEKEYLEFISLLKLYINSQNSKTNIVHLIYIKDNPILLDENKNIINITSDLSKVKYLSDISFSTNDYILNTLLNLIPKQIYVHIIDNYVDEFLSTISLIFETRVKICTDCDICKLYKKVNIGDKNGG